LAWCTYELATAQLPVHAQGESFQESRMREICMSGSTRGE
jgi:hypothetical protein